MNKVILMGRLCKEPEISSSTGGTTIARYSIAVDRKYKKEGEPDADFFNLVSFGKQGQFVEKYLHKGTKIVISGTLQNNNYTNREGKKIYETRVITDDVEFAESKGSQTETQQQTIGSNDSLNVAPEILEELPFS